MLAHVDDPLCIGRKHLIQDLFSALSGWLTTKITEVIGPKPVVFLGARVWRAEKGFREMAKEGYIEELGEEWGADRGRAITSPGIVDQKIEEEETPLCKEDHRRFRRGVGKVQYILPRRPDFLFATKQCSRRLAAPTNHDGKKLERLVKWIYATRAWSFRLEPDADSVWGP